MTKFLLAAGVAALAITAPASAERGGPHDNNPRAAAKAQRGGGRNWQESCRRPNPVSPIFNF